MEARKFSSISRGLQNLCSKDKYANIKCKRYLVCEDLIPKDTELLLQDLASLLCRPCCTENVAQSFPQMLLELLTLAENNNKGDNFHRQMCVTLGKLVQFHPDVLRFSFQYFKNHCSPFDSHSDAPPHKKRKKTDDLLVEEIDIVTSCYNFLMVACEHFREIWDWSKFINLYVTHDDPLICWIACHCFAWVSGMTEAERSAFLANYLDLKTIRACKLQFDNIQSSLANKLAYNCDSISDKDLEDVFKSSSVVTVAGIQLSSAPLPIKKTGFLVPVSSTLSNLHNVALGIASNKAICLQGPVGSGKTALVEHLADITGRAIPPNFIKVQLGDETDSKMLLGTYRCTDVPGEFVWQPGVLTQAAVNGFWLLLEDIDTAAMDVASVLASLLETRALSVPGFKDNVKVAPGFQLFLTQRSLPSVTGFQKPVSNSSSLLSKHWLQINIEPLSKSELIEMLQTMFPALQTVASRMVKVFLLFSSGNHQLALNASADEEDVGGPSVESHAVETSGRLVSTRDLIKWCYRAIEGFDVCKSESALKILQDGIDIFCCSVADADIRLKLAISIANCLGIVHTKAEFFSLSYKPSVQFMSKKFSAGRATLKKQEENVNLFARFRKAKFAFTRPAACLLERVMCCIYKKEPVLLVGETGTGKTSVVQFLAQSTNNHLLVINMNQQSDSSDLLGGYKPVDLKFIVAPVREEFEKLFTSFFSVSHNLKYLENIATCFGKRKWNLLLRLMKQSHNAAVNRLRSNPKEKARFKEWIILGERLQKLETQVNAQSALAFAFVEGSLVKALKEGYWVLLDEINLACPETLQCLSGLLEGSAASLYLLERGDREPVKRHPNFHLFACMNPATDVGKKDLPAGLRNRFTEFFVDELTEVSDLILLVGKYLSDLVLPVSVTESVVKFYLKIRGEASKNLNDGTGRKPHYSLRTLCRALSVAATNPCGAVLRSLYEGLCLSFLTQLDHASHTLVLNMISKAVFGKDKTSILKHPLVCPQRPGEKYVNFEGYWVLQGNLEPVVPDKYILTPSVRQNLHDLVRVVAIGRHPVLLQGETSVGKTSLITYLAKASGNHCVRINNHEHTDIQEYVGSYSADENGCLVFREGVLVEAMRKGHWIILDELNLAPTDVLEALNRVLDDNRELYIPETQETVKAHQRFMLFATQNPSGLYGGRKMLSRAFRNRFVELHFAEIPPKELEIILENRCQMPASYCKKLVAVMTDLQLHRRGSAAFAGKQGFMTLRDLFRWGERYTRASYQSTTKFYDWDQHLADEGYLVLAGRVRKAEEAEVICQTLKKHVKRTVDPQTLFTLNEKTSTVTKEILEKVTATTIPGFEHIVWTYNMRRLAVLVGKSCSFQEPILLVGETGCGKTTVCQMLAFLNNQSLFSVNCHMHTECADFLGGLRPVREHDNEEGPQKLFEWVDGPLINAMHQGSLFLADEISLADDSVLERLNSLLEPERTLLLAEKGSDGTDDSSLVIVAHENFHFVGTMNPGGDYGKKELSPALRNRFTEIWCQSCESREDLMSIIKHNLRSELSLDNEQLNPNIETCMMDFIEWFRSTEIGKRFPVSVRDILSWVNFINLVTQNPMCQLNLAGAYVHGACVTFFDSFGSGVTSLENLSNLRAFHKKCLTFLHQQLQLSENELQVGTPTVTEEFFGIPPFFINVGNNKVSVNDFTFNASTTALNALRVLRAMQLAKPILLEGSPGVGKTTLITALAKVSGHNVIRINLSEQTDISDLFGADLPVEGGQGGQFAWRDGPLLRALKAGDWILLDELNLASQSVLEGLNACLDHRGEIFIPELSRSFHVKPGRTFLFGAQNPLKQGGARRGLPQSFLNRFTQVFIDALKDEDLEFIISCLYPMIPSALVKKMVQFNSRLARETGELRLWGFRGGPWELNLRDIMRWCQAMTRYYTCNTEGREDDVVEGNQETFCFNPGLYVDLIYINRMRTIKDKERVKEIYCEEFGSDYPLACEVPQVCVTEKAVFIGDEVLTRLENEDAANTLRPPCSVAPEQSLLLLRKQYSPLRSLARCVNLNWMSIIVGPSSSGKTSLVRLLAQLAGRELRIMAVNSAMDTTEILGGFEQADLGRRLEAATARTERIVLARVRTAALERDLATATRLLARFADFRSATSTETRTLAEESRLLNERAASLRALTEASAAGLPPHLRPHADAVLRDLEELTRRSARAHALTAGGAFEWVDSLLVKCLRDGCWLLLDGANLCSPAVLDRLNSLLEPGGMLTIGERGVGADGELVTVAPHPDFRLFLALDPRHGDISRAMRNRGVELCLPEEQLGALDLAALLSAHGLRRHAERQALLAAHSAASAAWPGAEPPGLSELLHAAFLAAQRMARGQGARRALLASCCDVYVKAHTRALSSALGGAAAAKQILLQVVSAALAQAQTLAQEGAGPGEAVERAEELFPVADATPHAALLLEDSAAAAVRQQGALLATLLGALALTPHGASVEFLAPLLDMHHEDIAREVCASAIEILPHLLFIFYETASARDLPLRHDWLCDLVERRLQEASRRSVDLRDCLQFALKVSEALRNRLQAASSLITQRALVARAAPSSQDLPLDLRWLPDASAGLVQREEAAHVDGNMNRVALLTYFEFLRTVEAAAAGAQQQPPAKQRPVTVAEYSKAVCQGKMLDSITSHPLVLEFWNFLRNLDNYIIVLLSSKGVIVTNDDWAVLVSAFSWRFHLGEQGSLHLVGEPGSRSVDRVISQLTVHMRWLLKHAIPPLEALAAKDLSLDSKQQNEVLYASLDIMKNAMSSSQTPLHRIGKKLRRIMGQPLPFATEEQNKLAQRIERLSNMLLVWPTWDCPYVKQLARRAIFLLSDEGKEAQKCLSTALENLRNDKELEIVKEKLEKAERLCQNIDFSANCNPDLEQNLYTLEEEKKNLLTNAQVQLWPIQEYMVVILGIVFMKRILLKKTMSDVGGKEMQQFSSSEDVSRTLCLLIDNLPSIPAEMLSFIHQFTRYNENEPSLCDLIRVIYLHRTLSPSRFLPSYWLTWNTANKDNVDEHKIDFDMSQDLLPMHCPVLTTLMVNLLLPKEVCDHATVTELVTQIPLGNQEPTAHKLSVVLDVLWRNMTSLASPSFDYQLNDGTSAHTAFMNLTTSLNSALLEANKKVIHELSSEESVAKNYDIFMSNHDDKFPQMMPLSETLHKLEAVGNKLGHILSTGKGETDLDLVIATGETWLLIGCVQVNLLSKFAQFDPVEKKSLELLYTTEELKYTSQHLYAHELQAKFNGENLAYQSLNDIHPFIAASRLLLSKLTAKKSDLSKKIAHRPSHPYYSDLMKDADHYCRTLGSVETVLGFQKRFEVICKKLFDSIHDTQALVHLVSAAEELLKEERAWRNSQHIFVHRLRKHYYIHFPDLVGPLISASLVLTHGTSLVASSVQKLLVQLKVLFADDIVRLVQFPIIVPNKGLPLKTTSLVLDHAFCQQLQQLLQEQIGLDFPIKREMYRLMKAALQDIHCVVVVQGKIDCGTWDLFIEILSRLAKVWMLESEERKQREREKEQMFVQKGTTQCETMSDEKLEALGIQELFPSFAEEDFGDLQLPDTLDSDPIPLPKEKTPKLSELVSSDDIVFISQLHWEIVTSFTHTHWISPLPACTVEPNFVTPLLQRFQTFRQLLPHIAEGLNSNVDWKLAPSLALLASLSLRAGSGETISATVGDLSNSPVRGSLKGRKKAPDFYRDANVDEARQCMPILDVISKRTKELLNEWPDHPALGQIMVVIERISAFPIVSPLSRFLTGLEILLDKLRDWEENAHSGVSLSSHITLVTNQIIAWRRLELHCWKDCLNNAAYRMSAEASHWWFHIFLVVDDFVKSRATTNSLSGKELIKTLQEFMEKSTLGDFHQRLDILYAFHCHATHLSSKDNHGLLVNIFWNTVQYYRQFSEAVDLRIKSLKAPIEKKLRDFVKIARWNDINYWSVKKGIEKTRQTLLKYIREFESVLKQPVTSILTNPHPLHGSLLEEGAGKLDQKRQSNKHTELATHFYVASKKPLLLITHNEETQKPNTLLSRAEMYFNKSRTLCREVLPLISYPNLVKSMDECCVDMIHTVNHFKELQIPNDLSEAKRKSIAKNHLQQKKKALSDGFRTLQQIGLSYRLGITAWNNTDVAEDLFDFRLPPLDLNVGVQHSSFQMSHVLKNTMTGSELATMWDGSETYFYRSIARLSLLDTFLKNPHKNIGPALIERLRGFPSHLMMLAKTQKEELTKAFDLLRSLRCYITQVSLLKKSDSILPKQSNMKQNWNNINNLLVNIIICAQQFLVFLRACPTEPLITSIVETVEDIPNMNSAVFGDACWQSANKKLKNIVSTASKVKNALNKSWIAFPQSSLDSSKLSELSDLITPSQLELINEGYDKVTAFLEEIKSVKAMFESSQIERPFLNPMTDSLNALEILIEKGVSGFKEMQDLSSPFKRTEKEIENKNLEISLNASENGKESPSELAMDVDDDIASNMQWNIHISLTDKEVTHENRKEVIDEFFSGAESLLKITLLSIQKIYKKYAMLNKENPLKESAENSSKISEGKSNDEKEEEGEILENHLKGKVIENLGSDMKELEIPTVINILSKLIQQLIKLMDLDGWEKEADTCKGILWTCIPCIDQLSLLYLYFVTQQAAAYRVSTKMMSVILSISIDLAQKGFCIPDELMPEDGEGEGQSKGGLGLGEGEGEKDVSDKIQSEDQLEGAKRPEDDDDDDKECKEEEQGVDTSLDFGGKTQDIEKNSEEEDEESNSGEEDEELDKEMGETGDGADTLDQEVWGSDSEDEKDSGEEEEKEDQHGEGEQTGKPEMKAKDDKNKQKDPNDEDGEEEEEGEDDKKEEAKDINEFNEVEGEDHTDPYHGKHKPLPEPEPLDLPDDLQLDEEDLMGDQEEEENPFEIDSMKEPKVPEENEGENQGEDDEGEKAADESEVETSEEEGGEEDGIGDSNKENMDGDDVEEDNVTGSNETEEKKEEKNDENEDNKEDKQNDLEKALPSDDQPSETPAETADMEAPATNASKDKVTENFDENKDDGKQDADDLGEEGGNEEEGVGQSQAEQQKTGHRGHLSTPKDKLPSKNSSDIEEKKDKRQRPGESDSNRSLGNISEPVKKKLKSVDLKEQNEEEITEDEESEPAGPDGKEGDIYQHIKDSKAAFDTQILDAATKEQSEKQPVPNKEDEPAEELTEEDEVLNEDDIVVEDDQKKIKPEKMPSNKKHKGNEEPKEGIEEGEGDVDMVDIEGENVPTQAPLRKPETTYHTQYDTESIVTPNITKEADLQAVRQELENQLLTWTEAPADAEAAQAWQNFVAVTSALSRELSEQLRLVLEPTQAARLRGDYRTGRRINMRKVIPYIASQFRKDKIWLRRTKPSKREYQIVLAIDDSSSMADNHTKQLAFESLALVSRALSLLEAGELAVVSFGESPRILHQLGDTFTEQNGGRLLQEFSFSQKHTKVGQLVDFCTMLLQDSRQRVSTNSECAQLLMIVSDGRGVFSEGDERVRLAIRHARQSRIFMVFVILDNPESKNSILDIRTPIFQGGKLLGIKSYLDSFPFPFYLILQDINGLPAVLSDALRQWFELVTNTDSQ